MTVVDTTPLPILMIKTLVEYGIPERRAYIMALAQFGPP